MSLLDRDEGSFQDASAYFSEEEWKLLHEWQKELYRNVMKEIHQALLSLGPLIVTTVFSLRVKEKQELYLPDNHVSQRRHDEKPVPIYIDRLGEEVKKRSSDLNPGHGIISFCVKDEEESYCVDRQNIKRLGHLSSPAEINHPPIEVETKVFPVKASESRVEPRHQVHQGDGKMKRRQDEGGSENCCGKGTLMNTSSLKAKVKMSQIDDKRATFGSHVPSGVNQETEVERATQYTSGFSDQTNLSFHQGTPRVQLLETPNDWQSDLHHVNLLTCQPNMQKNWSLYSCTECSKTFSRKQYLVDHKKTHVGARPYQCTQCEKSFSKKDNLFVHKRAHTGERPYHCVICDKSFSQKGVLNRHQRIHIGERPYQCIICEKRFSQKGVLNRHQRTHMGERPYQCTDCEKSFSQKGSLISHQKTHSNYKKELIIFSKVNIQP
ncbi:zinc finger protein interacting with ribonucleoprotein K-like isoform X2 [Ambystoma mexicanum]|uniref:zinc finger protein interacting with ribonucleoprotein K-like isoform X2 n=1 Tax=Ambystoma mexicanum TaxID=8296 RepID=UPI0037E84404